MRHDGTCYKHGLGLYKLFIAMWLLLSGEYPYIIQKPLYCHETHNDKQTAVRRTP